MYTSMHMIGSATVNGGGANSLLYLYSIYIQDKHD